MKMRTTLSLAIACGLAAACSPGERNEAATGPDAVGTGAQVERSDRNLAEGIAEAGDHGQFMQAVESAGLTETLRGAGPYTVFAPTDAAFQAVPEDARGQLMAADQRERLIGLISYHIVPGTVTAEDIGAAIDRGEGGRAELATIAGGTLSFARDGDAIVITDAAGARARIVQADRAHSNGVAHSVDSVLMPAD